MTEPTYTITITESERTAMASALGTFVTKLTNCRVQIEAPTGGTHAARALLSPSTAPPAAAPAASPIEQRDRWARDRKGNEAPSPEGCYPADVHIWKTQQSEKYLKVTWQSSSGNGYADANCFDQKLWPWLIKSAGQRTRLYVVAKGTYLNIVGVRA
jgi:hypothetical protein